MLDKPEKVRVDLTGPAQTMLDMLYAKALDAAADDPILGDTHAPALVRQLDYDWRQTKITTRNKRAFFAAVRSAHFDEWARQFLAVHPESVVLHLGCGLDARMLRLQPGPGVDWYDVDSPEVISLREQFYPANGRYRLVAASVTDPGWLAAIPSDRPVLLLAEGLTMYLEESGGIALLRRVLQRFPSGELQFDALTRLGIRSSQALLPVVRQSGSTLRWAVNGPSDIVRAVPGTRLLSSIPALDAELLARAPRRYRLAARLLAPLPPAKKAQRFYRYAF
jgi:O-methyltransferase involved in polyketide biosynthesis